MPSLHEAAARFAQAWHDSDEAVLSEMAVDPLSVDPFLRGVRRAGRQGAISSFEVVIEDVTEPVALPVPSPSPSPGALEAPVPYTVEWSSDASLVPVELEGVAGFELRDGEWKVALNRSLLWPGILNARRFLVAHRWPRRGAILDREGRPLARGSAERRTYPQGTLAGTTIGHLKALTRADIAAGAIGAVGDVVGGSGMEQAYDERLGGRPRISLTVVGARGRVLRVVGKPHPLTKGRNVHSTLDVDIQRAAEQAHGGMTGGAVVIDPGNGDVLAVVDSSVFGPANYVGAVGVQPFNRALSGLYPPGSAMKVMTAAAALDSGTVTPTTTVTGPKEYKGVRNFESGEFGSIPFSTAVQKSVNTAFAQVAEDLGARKLHRYAERFGFNREPRIGSAATSSFPFPEDLGDVMWSSVGQAQTLATPLQMASLAGTIGNGGKRMEPRLASHEPRLGSRSVTPGTAAAMTRLMESVVQGGTGTAASLPGVSVAGKTGTAEVDVGGERRNHAWFVAFAPSNAPEVAVAVVAEYGGVGGEVAAPLARSILQAVLPLI